MSETFDNETGEPIDSKSLMFGVSALSTAIALGLKTVSEHQEMLGKAGSALLDAVKANPKVAVTIAGVAGVGYCVHRLTQKGCELSIGSFRFKRD